ncbi:MAG: response regulator [Desulfobulbaceae bacterium]|nr:response regulator [Desulfobulbaceae bacterium]
MRTKWKVIISIILLIIAICIVFAILVLRQHDSKVAEVIKGKGESATLLADTLLGEFSKRYQDRIRAFTNPDISPSREKMIRAFSDRDHDKLFLLSNRLFTVFKKENPYFSTMGWILPDNLLFLRLPKKGKYGEDISKMRPDIVAVNRDKLQNSGFEAGYMGMQYRITQPVFYQDKYLGVAQFGIKASVIFDTLQNRLNTIAGMAVLNEKCDIVQESKMPKLKCRTHTVRSRDADLFKSVQNQLDWNKAQQRVVINGKAHVIINVLPVANFQDEKLGVFFVAMDISEELAQKHQLTVTILVVSTILLILSFLILYFSYGSLVQKIIILNQSLEKNNLELEDRVHERSIKLQESEKQLHRAQKMEAIGLMAGGVAHDLNNILSGIVSYPELLLMQLPENSELRVPIKAIQESGKRAATVVADLLTVARGAAISKKPHDIHVLINEYLHSPEYEKLCSMYPEIVSRERLNADHSIISCSSIHIKKAVMNLVGNSMEAIDSKGTIGISTRNQQLDTNEASKLDVQAGDYLILSVNDDGKGIAEKDLEHIFEPFYTRKVMGKSGTGLGLAIVWNSMQDHNGRVTVESNEHGTCFDLYFPIDDTQDIVEEKRDENTILLVDTNKHILVVDDEPQLRDIASKMLESVGYKNDSVCSGELAIKFVKDNPVDLVILDMLMDPGMNGLQTYEEILKLHPNQKAIIVSGFSESDDVKAALRLGAGWFIKKPYSIAQLGRAIEEVLNS